MLVDAQQEEHSHPGSDSGDQAQSATYSPTYGIEFGVTC